MSNNTCRLTLAGDLAKAMSACKAGDKIKCEVEIEFERAETRKAESSEGMPMSMADEIMAKKKGGKPEHRMEMSGKITGLKVADGKGKAESKKSGYGVADAILARKKGGQ